MPVTWLQLLQVIHAVGVKIQVGVHIPQAEVRVFLPEGLIALGGLVAYENVIMRVFGDVMWRWGQNNPVFRAFYLMLDELPQIVTCVALIVCGLWLVRGPKGKKVHRKKAEEPEDEDFREYTAAEADAPEAPEETADFAMPKLSALLGDPVTPEDPDEPEQPENAEGDDGRTE